MSCGYQTLNYQDLPGGPAAKTLLPVQGTWVQYLVRELDSHIQLKKKKRSHMPPLKIPRATTNKDGQSYVLQVRPGAAKYIS